MTRLSRLVIESVSGLRQLHGRVGVSAALDDLQLTDRLRNFRLYVRLAPSSRHLLGVSLDRRELPPSGYALLSSCRLAGQPVTANHFYDSVSATTNPPPGQFSHSTK